MGGQGWKGWQCLVVASPSMAEIATSTTLHESIPPIRTGLFANLEFLRPRGIFIAHHISKPLPLPNIVMAHRSKA